MRNSQKGGSVSVRYRLVDIREFSAEPLLASERLEDNVIAVLMRAGDERAVVRRVLRRIADGKPERRGDALAELAIFGDPGGIEETVGYYYAGGTANAAFRRHYG